MKRLYLKLYNTKIHDTILDETYTRQHTAAASKAKKLIYLYETSPKSGDTNYN